MWVSEGLGPFEHCRPHWAGQCGQSGHQLLMGYIYEVDTPKKVIHLQPEVADRPSADRISLPRLQVSLPRLLYSLPASGWYNFAIKDIITAIRIYEETTRRLLWPIIQYKWWQKKKTVQCWIPRNTRCINPRHTPFTFFFWQWLKLVFCMNVVNNLVIPTHCSADCIT